MESSRLNIREINDEQSLEESAGVIRDSFGTVAAEFRLTRSNCPTHPSFVTVHQLEDLKLKGAIFFGLFLGGNQTGFIAVEKADSALYYIEKLAVLPEHRRRGYGRKLMEHAAGYIRENNGERISIGIINEHKSLKAWYKKLGFMEISTKKFPLLPFTVCFMEKIIGPLQ